MGPLRVEVSVKLSSNIGRGGEAFEDRDQLKQRRVTRITLPRRDGQEVAWLQEPAADSVVHEHHLAEWAPENAKVLCLERRRMWMNTAVDSNLGRGSVDHGGAVVPVEAT